MQIGSNGDQEREEEAAHMQCVGLEYAENRKRKEREKKEVSGAIMKLSMYEKDFTQTAMDDLKQR